MFWRFFSTQTVHAAARHKLTPDSMLDFSAERLS